MVSLGFGSGTSGLGESPRLTAGRSAAAGRLGRAVGSGPAADPTMIRRRGRSWLAAIHKADTVSTTAIRAKRTIDRAWTGGEFVASARIAGNPWPSHTIFVVVGLTDMISPPPLMVSVRSTHPFRLGQKICGDRGGERGDALPRGQAARPLCGEGEHGDRSKRISSVMGGHIASGP